MLFDNKLLRNIFYSKFHSLFIYLCNYNNKIKYLRLIMTDRDEEKVDDNTFNTKKSSDIIDPA